MDIFNALKQRAVSFLLLVFSMFAFAAACTYGPLNATPFPAIGIAVVAMSIFCHFTRGMPARNFTRAALLFIMAAYIVGVFFV